MSRYVILLRGVNVGTANRVKMADVRAALELAGFDRVRTYLQSGNVVVDSRAAAPTVARRAHAALVERLGLDVPAVVRTADELRAVVSDDPLVSVVTDPARHFVAFCSAAPDIARLPDATEPEALVARGADLHLWCPGGARDSRLMAALGRYPGPPATVRNWNTVIALDALLDG